MTRIGLLILVSLVAFAGCGQKQESPPPAESTQQAAEGTQAAAPDTMAAPSGIPEVAGDTITTESGLKYIDLKVGGGATPTAGQLVSAHYTGWLTDGSKFDSSRDKERPIQFPIGQRRVIPGWDEGLMSMAVGGRRILIIPPELAYGARGRPPQIPPNSTLVFDVELVAVADAPAAP